MYRSAVYNLTVLILSILAGTGYAADEEVSLESLLNEMVDSSVLTRPPSPSYVAKSASSYDRSSKVLNLTDGFYIRRNGKGAKGWFGNKDYNRGDSGKNERVIMQDNGPGAIVRWWAPPEYQKKQPIRDYMIRIYLDGAETPAIEMGPDELVGGNGLVEYPFSFLASDEKTRISYRAHNLYLPIPYQKSCKITYQGIPWYYQIGYRRYAAGTRVKTFTMQQLTDAKSTLKKVASLLTGERKVSGKKLRQSSITLAPGKSTKLTVDNPGAITSLHVQLSAKDYQQALRSTVIAMTYDGTQTAWLPIGALGGVGYSAEKNDTFYIKTDPTKRSIRCYYVMPFEKSATLTLTNHGKQNVTIEKFDVTVDHYKWSDRSCHFYATWFEKRNMTTYARFDLNFVKAKGTGRYVGTSITIFNTNGSWWGEGDDKTYVDGEKFPSIFGTGTEDYFGYAWCRPQRFNTPFISQPRGEGNKKPGYSNNNRYHLLDDIPFTNSVQFDMEVLHPYRANMNYAATTLFYAKPGATHNIKPDVDAVRHKVALEVKDVSVHKVTHGGPTVDELRPHLGYFIKILETHDRFLPLDVAKTVVARFGLEARPKLESMIKSENMIARINAMDLMLRIGNVDAPGLAEFVKQESKRLISDIKSQNRQINEDLKTVKDYKRINDLKHRIKLGKINIGRIEQGLKQFETRGKK